MFAVPGGPGTSGVADLRKRGGGFAQLRGWFDVVSFAPRNTWNLGVLPADCFISGPWITVPEDRAAYRRLAERNRRAAEECRAHDPEFFDHLDSASVARDIEAIRAALGEERLSLLATSYGATSAATYARLFPGRVRALAIDGAAGPVVDREEEARRQYQAIEEQFARFAAWCADTPDCALHGRDVGAVWRELTAAADRSPVPVRGDRVAYSGFDLKTAALPDLQSPGQAPEFVNWGRLARAIDAAVKGDASGFADNIEQITRSRKFPSTRGMNATHCTDGRGFADYAEFRRLKALGERLSPHFADVNLWHALGCVGWPAPVTNPPAPLPGDRLPDLVTGLDPARPLVYASLGTVAPLFRAADGHLAMIIEGLGQLDCEAVVAVGAGKKPADLGTAVPDNVHVVDVIAQPLLLDTVDLLVTHAGFTSVREALRAGVPMVAIPWIAENHLIARTCSEQGLAVELDWETLDAAQVAHACRTALSRVRRTRALRQDRRGSAAEAPRERVIPPSSHPLRASPLLGRQLDSVDAVVDDGLVGHADHGHAAGEPGLLQCPGGLHGVLGVVVAVARAAEGVGPLAHNLVAVRRPHRRQAVSHPSLREHRHSFPPPAEALF